MFKRFARRPSPALIVALLALFAGSAGVTYAATQGPPSFTAYGVESVPAGSNPTLLPITGPNTSGLANHGMTIVGTHAVAVPTTGIYLLTVNGNCNADATNTSLQVREGTGLPGSKVDLFVGFVGNPSLAGSNTVHLAAGTRLNMAATHGGPTVNCGATLGVSLLSADA
jgi:hypothetical protein